MVGGQCPNDLQRAALERNKQRAEAKGLAEIVTSREALKLQPEMESNPEYFIPGEKSSHKPPKATQHGVEARPVAEGNPERGRGRGRGSGKGRGRGGGEEDSVNCHQLQTLPEEFLKPNKLWNKAV